MKKNLINIILLLLILLVTLVDASGAPKYFSSSYAYVIRPLLWLLLGIGIFLFLKRKIYNNKKYEKDVNFIVLITTLVYFLIYFSLGYINGFAYNPYDVSFKGIMLNLWTFIPTLVVVEYVRYHIITHCGEKRILWWACAISIILCLNTLNINKFPLYFESSLTTFEFFFQEFMPAIITSLYLTYICYFGNYKISIFYSLLPKLVMYIFPILPNLQPQVLSIINSLVPFLSYVYINFMINTMDRATDKKELEQSTGIKGWLSMIAFIAVMICFGSGVFPVEPLVIASDSMNPIIHRGDMVILVDIDPKDVKVGDVIRYNIKEYYVVHRVQNIIENDDGTVSFIMKGDNNKTEDVLPVEEYQINGIVKINIPYLGYPTLILSELLNSNAGDKVIVETGS